MSFKCRISADLENLRVLHSLHPWILGPDNIRPDANILLRKSKLASSGVYDVNQWSRDLFNCSWEEALGKCYVFLPNMFPYNVPKGTKHFILWFGSREPLPDYVINSILEEEMCKLGGKDFVWYENPKMTVKDIWHVQVFWKEM
jgi:hypothetical protein